MNWGDGSGREDGPARKEHGEGRGYVSRWLISCVRKERRIFVYQMLGPALGK